MPEQSLDIAQAAFDLASQRRAELDAAAAEAAVKLQAALDHRETFIQRIAAGENLTAGDHRKAETSVREAESLAAVTAAAAEHGRRRFEQAQLAFWRAQVADLEARHVAAVDVEIEAARAIDGAMVTARAAVEGLDLARERRRAILAEAKAHAMTIAHLADPGAGADQNRPLAELRRGEWPVAKVGSSPTDYKLNLRVELIGQHNGHRPEVSGWHDVPVSGTAEDQARLAHGLPPLNPPPACTAGLPNRYLTAEEARAVQAAGARTVYQIEAVRQKLRDTEKAA